MIGTDRGRDGEPRGVFGHSPILARRELVSSVRISGTAPRMRPVALEPGRSGGDSLTRTMSRTSSQSSVRSIRRSVRWFTLKEYVGGALWVLPSVAGLLALAAGYGISQIGVRPDSRLNWIAFQGTADDARALLIAISSTVVTVIALVLGLTVVALQLSRQFFTAAVAQLSTGSWHPAGPQRFHCNLRLQRGRTFHRRRGGGARTESTRGWRQWRDRVALCQSRHGRLLRRPSGALDPDRRHHSSNRPEHPPWIAQYDPALVEEAATQVPDWAVPLPAAIRLHTNRLPRLLLPWPNEPTPPSASA